MCFSELAISFVETSRELNAPVTKAEDELWHFEFFGELDETENSPLFDAMQKSVRKAYSLAETHIKIWQQMAVSLEKCSGLYANILMEIFNFINPGFDCSNIKNLIVSYKNLMTEIENLPKN